MTVVPVSVAQSARRATTARASLLLCTCCAVAAVAALVVAGVAFATAPDLFRGLFALLAVVGVWFFGTYALLALRVWQDARTTSAGGTLAIADRTLVLDLPEVFARPVAIHADDLRAMAFDRRGLALPSLAWLRFPVRERGRAVGCLWRRSLPAPLPVAAAGPDLPTLVLLFRSPRSFPTANGAGRVGDAVAVLAAGSQLADVTAPEHLPGARPVDPAGTYPGLFVPVDDVRAARRATAPWPELRRVLRTEDVAGVRELLPMPGPVRTVAGAAVLGWLAVTVAAVVAELTGSADLPLLGLLLVPPTLALNAYVLARASRLLRTDGGSRPRRRIGAFALALTAAVIAVLQLLDLGSDPPTLPPGTPVVPVPYDPPSLPAAPP